MSVRLFSWIGKELWIGLVGLALSIFIVWSGYSLKFGTINDPGSGYGVALQPINLLYCFVDVFIGTLVGVLPGLGDVAAHAGDARRHAAIRHHHDGRSLLWPHVRWIDST